MTVSEASKALRNLRGNDSVIIGRHEVIRSGKGFATAWAEEQDPYADCLFIGGWKKKELLGHLLENGEIEEDKA